jgi:hypothetical protein
VFCPDVVSLSFPKRKENLDKSRAEGVSNPTPSASFSLDTSHFLPSKSALFYSLPDGQIASVPIPKTEEALSKTDQVNLSK